jgi:hypothetical protein
MIKRGTIEIVALDRRRKPERRAEVENRCGTQFAIYNRYKINSQA